MWRLIIGALVAIPLALSSQSAEAGYNKAQLQELNALIGKGDKVALVQFWNRNLSSVTRDSEVEKLLAEMMKDIRRNGDSEISASLRRASNRSVGITVGSNVVRTEPVWERPFVKILAALGHYD